MNKMDPRLNSLINELKAASRETGTELWSEIARQLEGPRRNYAEVNLGHIERYAKEDETIVVPGKGLGSGILNKGITIAAVDFSKSAELKIKQANGEPIRLEQALLRNKNGSNVRVLR
jgi:large subunit ribosomal protein L18e